MITLCVTDMAVSQLVVYLYFYHSVVCNFERGLYPFLSLKLGESVQILEENCGELHH